MEFNLIHIHEILTQSLTLKFAFIKVKQEAKVEEAVKFSRHVECSKCNTLFRDCKVIST